MNSTRDALSIYTDGSFNAKAQRMAYGWVTDEPTPRTRVVGLPTKSSASLSSVMESEAIIDAIAEFAFIGRDLEIYADNQVLALMIEKYRAGLIDGRAFLTRPFSLSEKAGHRLLRLMDHVNFNINWVRGHAESYENLVIDQALRMVTEGNETDCAGKAFAVDALTSGEAVVWGKVPHVIDGEKKYFNTYHRIAREQFH